MKKELSSLEIEKSVEIKQMKNGIICCVCFSLRKAINIMIIIALIDFLFTIATIFVGVLIEKRKKDSNEIDY